MSATSNRPSRFLGSAAIIAAASLAIGVHAGCSGCHDGDQPYCDGSKYMYCPGGDKFPSSWASTSCTYGCRVEAGGCVDSEQPIPECAQDSETCWNNATTQCRAGYPTNTIHCESGAQCVVVPGCAALCAVGAPDPNCTPETDLCDDGYIASCYCGYHNKLHNCGSPDLCHVAQGHTFCTLSATTDPRCDPALLDFEFCADNVAYGCEYGYLVKSVACTGSTPHCSTATGPAVCSP